MSDNQLCLQLEVSCQQLQTSLLQLWPIGEKEMLGRRGIFRPLGKEIAAMPRGGTMFSSYYTSMLPTLERLQRGEWAWLVLTLLFSGQYSPKTLGWKSVKSWLVRDIKVVIRY